MCCTHGRQQLRKTQIMIIESASVFTWLVAAVGGVISVLAGMAIWNNRNRFRELDERLKKVEDRSNITIPESIQAINTKITKLEGSLKEINTKVELTSDSVIQRMDKLERDLPGLIEAAVYRTLAAQHFIGGYPAREE